MAILSIPNLLLMSGEEIPHLKNEMWGTRLLDSRRENSRSFDCVRFANSAQDDNSFFVAGGFGAEGAPARAASTQA
jgi:hypothetical protein